MKNLNIFRYIIMSEPGAEPIEQHKDILQLINNLEEATNNYNNNVNNEEEKYKNIISIIKTLYHINTNVFNFAEEDNHTLEALEKNPEKWKLLNDICEKCSNDNFWHNDDINVDKIDEYLSPVKIIIELCKSQINNRNFGKEASAGAGAGAGAGMGGGKRKTKRGKGKRRKTKRRKTKR